MNGLQPAGDDLRAELEEAYGVADSVGAFVVAVFVDRTIRGAAIAEAATGVVNLYSGWKARRLKL